jgi:16S rRNA (guanine966-N2)-methyltransferase
MKKPRLAQVRIISGCWRGTKLSVPTVDGLRPTPDRIRETLFNWLGNDCRGANVLDCFAGSGALGFEAASRGARQVRLIERNSRALRNLEDLKRRLKADNIGLLQGDAVDLIPDLPENYDLVFVDPPYAEPDLRARVIIQLIEYAKLSDGARIYLEWPHGELFELPHPQLSWMKQKKAGQVHYAIAEWRLSR